MIKTWKVLLFLIVTTNGCSDDNPGSIDIETPSLIQKIDSILAAEDGFSGVVQVGTTKEILYSSGFGFSDRENQIPNSNETVFDIGSITKPFTGMAIAKCIEDGLLKIEDKLSSLFPGIPRDKANITILQLLTHSSGFTDSIGEDYDRVTREDFLADLFDSELLFPPGSRYEYSNVGYSLLAIIVGKVSGESYETYLKRSLFDPMKMTTAGYVIPNYDDVEIANGYDDFGLSSEPGSNLGKPNQLPWDVDGPFWHLRGNGGLLMSANDIHEFYKGIKNNTVLNQQSTSNIFTKYLREGEDDTFVGYAWSLSQTSKGNSAMHNGGNGIFFADLNICLEVDLYIFLASNAARESQESIIGEILEVL